MTEETTGRGIAASGPPRARAASRRSTDDEGAGKSCLRYSSPEALYRQERDSLIRALTLVCEDPALAEDSVQEAFARLCIKWKRIRAYDDPAAWVRRVALNLVQDYRRHLARRARLLIRLDGRSEPQSSSPMVADRDPLLWAAVRDLPARQRTALALYYLADLKVAEVAAAMNVSEGTVKRHLDRAREALRMKLEGRHER